LKPIFIFSLPRSGSTLLQRVLASHSEIDTVAEPWVLLPFLYALKSEVIFSEYSHVGASTALHDFLGNLPHGEEDYFEAVNLAVSSMYEKAGLKSNATYFLDKTPRYTLICDDVMKVFPDGKYIFLWRNPLAIIASLIETWGDGRWNVFYYKIDLFKALALAIQTYMQHSDKCLNIQYEKFLKDPVAELDRIGNYLGVQFDKKVLEDFSEISFQGGLGDVTGVKAYSQVSDEPLSKWKSTLCNPWRKWWCTKYLRWLGEERLGVMGYDLEQLLREVDEVPFSMRYWLNDLMRVFYGLVFCMFSPTIFKTKWKKLRQWKYITNHS